MRLPAVLASLTLLTVVFAGCSGGGDDDGGDGTTTSGSGTATGTRTGTSTSRSGTGTTTGSASGNSTGGGSGENQPPEGSITATVNGTVAAFSLNGTDPDDDTLTWELDFGDGAKADGTSLPATIEHTYTGEGAFTANFTLTDGELAATYNVTVTLAAGGGGGLGQVASMAWDVGLASQAGQTSGPPYLTCEDGPNRTFNYDSFELDLATLGLPFKATISSASGDPSIHSWRIYFNVEDCSAFAGGPFTATGAADITGIIPEDASTFVFVMATGGALLEVEYMSGSQIV